MKRITKPSANNWGILFLISLLGLSFSTGGSRSQYTIPTAAWSVTAGDIDMDGDNDIVVGHNYNSQTEWGGVSILLNNGYGYFDLADSIFLFGWQPDILTKNLDAGLPEQIIAKYENAQEENEYIAIINGPEFDSISYYSLDIYIGIDKKTTGDINGDGRPDIVVASNHGQFWGVMFNDSNGSFSSPEYYSISNSYPTDIACGDLNGDNREDIVICGQSTEVYFSYLDGFQPLTLETNNFKQGAFILDFDLDGLNDIITFVGIPIVNVSSLIMYKNMGNNQFDTIPEFYFGQLSSQFFVTDFNNDNLPDVLFRLTDKTGYIIYYNQGDFQLADSQFVALPLSNPEEGWRDCYCADMDGNGYNDIITIKTLYIYLSDNLVILFNDGNGNFQQIPVTGIEVPGFTPQAPGLLCYPNPFSSQLSIEINSSTSQNERLEIYDMKGRLVRTIVDGKNTPYVHEYIWNGKGLNGKEVEPGIYLVRLISGRKAYTQRVIKIN